MGRELKDYEAQGKATSWPTSKSEEEPSSFTTTIVPSFNLIMSFGEWLGMRVCVVILFWKEEVGNPSL
jgi:hypothetical protein